ncbi:MAG TPA: phage holin family protein [Candidatus Binatia bacterium]|nr:phage holin family protein [Candidatus Binatia bacterium]
MLSRLVDFYATQARIVWEWRGGRLALLRRLVITLIVSTVSFVATAEIMGSSMTVDRILDGVLAVIVIAIFNAVIRPVVLAAAARVSLILVAVVVLVLQVVAFLIVTRYVPGVHVSGFVAALIASFIYAIINTILTSILGIDRGDSYYGLLVQRLLAKRTVERSDDPGVVIVQIDGLAFPILAGRIRAGSANTMAGWIRDKTHTLSRWEAILPSMTSASQAGILHGNNDGIPAFRWYERDRQHLMVSSNPVDAALIVSRVSNGEGLLSNNGASICNLMSGDATRSYLTTAALKAEGGGIGQSNAFMSFFLSPTGYLRSFTQFLGEFSKELVQARRTKRAGIRPQMHRGLKYAGMRAASNTLLRDVNTALIIDEMYSGTNVIYADFTDYDEIAHHSGPERVEAFEAWLCKDALERTRYKQKEAAALLGLTYDQFRQRYRKYALGKE